MRSSALQPNDSLAARMESSSLINDDLAPVPASGRTWSMWSIAALWVGMAICITTYTLASSLIEQGMNWKQAVLTIFLGNLIVLIPMTLNAHPGTAYGIPFPVLMRASFGTLGSNIPALMRALVACGWFGIQTWIGGAAIYAMSSIIFGFDPAQKTALPVIGISSGEFLCFMIFWAINILVIVKGMESIKWLEIFAAPFLIVPRVPERSTPRRLPRTSAAKFFDLTLTRRSRPWRGRERISAKRASPRGALPAPGLPPTRTPIERSCLVSEVAARRSGSRIWRPRASLCSNVNAVGRATSSAGNEGFHPRAHQSWAKYPVLPNTRPRMRRTPEARTRRARSRMSDRSVSGSPAPRIHSRPRILRPGVRPAAACVAIR